MTASINGTTGVTFPDASVQGTAATGFGFKNRIINGACMIDQRNAGASVTPTSGQYVADRWRFPLSQPSKISVQQNAGSIAPPSGFVNYLGVTSLTSYSVGAGELFLINQQLEGLNVADLGWGTSSAASVTLSFWVRSSITGTFGGAVRNDNADRSYPYVYTITAANTWEYKTVTIPGDTTGTWLKTNGVGISLYFGLGVGSTLSGTAGAWSAANYVSATGATSVVGTNGATFYITGVQLEKGSTATSFDYRPYSTELALCQRYYYKVFPGAVDKIFGVGANYATTAAQYTLTFPVTLRTTPSALEQSGTANNYNIVEVGNNSWTCSSVPVYNSSTTTNMAVFNFTVSSGLTQYRPSQGKADSTNGATAYLAWSAEL